MKNKTLGHLLILISLFGSFSFPLLAGAQDAEPGSSKYHLIIKCEGKAVDVQGKSIHQCDFKDLVRQINAIITFLFYISVMLATIAFIYCGFLFLTAGGDAGKAKQAREIMYKVVIGFIWIFAAFLVVKFITSAFDLDPSITLIN